MHLCRFRTALNGLCKCTLSWFYAASDLVPVPPLLCKDATSHFLLLKDNSIHLQLCFTSLQHLPMTTCQWGILPLVLTVLQLFHSSVTHTHTHTHSQPWANYFWQLKKIYKKTSTESIIGPSKWYTCCRQQGSLWFCSARRHEVNATCLPSECEGLESLPLTQH